MKNAEEILKVIFENAGEHETTKDIALKAMHEYAAQDRWVKVSERLPEKGERVLCNTIYGVQIGWLTIKGDWQFTNGGSQISITHWQPLPTPPKD